MENYKKVLKLFNELKPHLYPNAGFNSNLYNIDLGYTGKYIIVITISGKYNNPNILYSGIIAEIDRFYKWYDLGNVTISIIYHDGSKPDTLSYFEMFEHINKSGEHHGLNSHQMYDRILRWSKNKDADTSRNNKKSNYLKNNSVGSLWSNLIKKRLSL